MIGLYLTEIKNKRVEGRKTRSLSVNRFKNNNSLYVAKNKGFSNAKKAVLDYIVSEETEYLDLNKCEDHYNKTNFIFSKEENSLELLKLKRLQKARDLDLIIEQEVQANTMIEIQDVLDFYVKEINSLQNKIKDKKRDISNYIQYQKKTYQTNYNLKNKLSEELKKEAQNEFSSTKYKIISLNAKRSLNKQKNLLNKLNNFEKKCEDFYSNEGESKTFRFKNLEYDVFKIKSDTLDIANILEDTKHNFNLYYEDLKKIEKKNNRISKHNRILKKSITYNNVKLNQLLRKLKAKDVDQLIKKYMEASMQFQCNNSLFQNINKRISELNSTLTQLTQEQPIIVSTNQKDETVNVSFDNEEQPIQSSLMEEKSFLIVNFVSFICKYNKIISPYLKENRYISDEKEPESNSEINTDFSVSEIKDLLQFVIRFFNKFLYLYFSHLIKITLSIAKTKNSKNAQILDVHNSAVQNIFDEQVNKAFFNLENKKKIFSKTEKEIFKFAPINGLVGDINDKNSNPKKKQKIETLYSHFLENEKKKEKKDFGRFNSILRTLKPKILTDLKKFTNTLILEENKVCKKSANMNKVSANQTSTNLEREYPLKLKIKLRKINKTLNKNDSEESLKENQLNTDFGQQSVHCLNTNSKRKNDIYNLENKFFRIKKKMTLKLDEISENFKKKITKSSLKNIDNLSANQSTNMQKDNTVTGLRASFDLKKSQDTSEAKIMKPIRKNDLLSLKHQNMKIKHLNELFDDTFLDSNSTLRCETLPSTINRYTYSTNMTTESNYGKENMIYHDTSNSRNNIGSMLRLKAMPKIKIHHRNNAKSTNL